MLARMKAKKVLRAHAFKIAGREIRLCGRMGMIFKSEQGLSILALLKESKNARAEAVS